MQEATGPSDPTTSTLSSAFWSSLPSSFAGEHTVPMIRTLYNLQSSINKTSAFHVGTQRRKRNKNSLFCSIEFPNRTDREPKMIIIFCCNATSKIAPMPESIVLSVAATQAKLC